MKVSTYRELIVWQKAMQLVKEIYFLTETFPRDETYGLASQIQRAAVSIPSNIAEGYVRKHKKEYLHHLSIALGSAAELETQLLICQELNKLNHLNFSQAESLNTEILKMLYVMIEKVEI
jgi:four helix bundle protein